MGKAYQFDIDPWTRQCLQGGRLCPCDPDMLTRRSTLNDASAGGEEVASLPVLRAGERHPKSTASYTWNGAYSIDATIYGNVSSADLRTSR